MRNMFLANRSLKYITLYVREPLNKSEVTKLKEIMSDNQIIARGVKMIIMCNDHRLAFEHSSHARTEFYTHCAMGVKPGYHELANKIWERRFFYTKYGTAVVACIAQFYFLVILYAHVHSPSSLVVAKGGGKKSCGGVNNKKVDDAQALIVPVGEKCSKLSPDIFQISTPEIAFEVYCEMAKLWLAHHKNGIIANAKNECEVFKKFALVKYEMNGDKNKAVSEDHSQAYHHSHWLN